MSSAPRQCLYCPSPLTADTRAAHVIPRAMGGRIKSTATVCSECNGLTAPFEDDLCEALRPIAAPLDIKRDDGKPGAPEVVEIAGIGRVAISGNEPVARSISIDETTTPDGRKAFDVQLPDDPELVAEHLAHLLRRTNKTPDDLGKGCDFTGNVHSNYVRPQARATIGTRPHQRAVAKIAVELLAFHDLNAARRPELAPLREFVIRDLGDAQVLPDFDAGGSSIVDLATLPKFAHVVEVWSAGSWLVGRVCFFGHVTFSLPLTSSWLGGPVCATYAVDPVAGANLINDLRRQDGPLPKDWPKRRVPSAEERTAANTRLRDDVQAEVDRKWSEQASQDVMDEWVPTLTAGQALTGKDVGLLVQKIAERAAPAMMRQDSRVPFDLEAIMPRVRYHFERLSKKR